MHPSVASSQEEIIKKTEPLFEVVLVNMIPGEEKWIESIEGCSQITADQIPGCIREQRKIAEETAAMLRPTRKYLSHHLVRPLRRLDVPPVELPLP